jgi:hypothetical protein
VTFYLRSLVALASASAAFVGTLAGATEAILIDVSNTLNRAARR